MNIATLGPKGTFSHEAALKHSRKSKIIFTNTIRDVFGIVAKGSADFGIVPIENSITGTVGQSLHCLIDNNLKIKSEVLLKIEHCVVGFADSLRDIKSLYIHPQTYEQCERFIKKEIPKARIIYTSSNGRSAEMISKSKDKTQASIVPNIAIGIYNLKVLKKNVKDNRLNITRFFVVAKSDDGKSGFDRTSIAVYPHVNKPGVLYSILGQFAKRGINLAKIESRPSKAKLGRYIFYIEFDCHRTENHIIEALKKIEEYSDVTMLGSYKRGSLN